MNNRKVRQYEIIRTIPRAVSCQLVNRKHNTTYLSCMRTSRTSKSTWSLSLGLSKRYSPSRTRICEALNLPKEESVECRQCHEGEQRYDPISSTSRLSVKGATITILSARFTRGNIYTSQS